MKKILLLLTSWLMIHTANAQKFGYIDADFILNQMPSYQKAQQDVKDAASKWEEDINARRAKLNEVKAAYDNEEILLTQEMKEERLAEIRKQEEEILAYQKKIFGYQGLFFTRQQELIKPAQEELYKVVQKVARKNSLQFIFTNTEGLTILYAEPRHDYTEEVLEELDLKEEEENPENK